MSEIEAEIRRQLIEERDRALQGQIPPSSDAANGAPPAPASGGFEPPPPLFPTGSSYHALPPPPFPSATPSYPPHYPSASYPPPYPPQQAPSPSLPPGSPQSSSAKSTQRKGVLGGLGAIGIALAKFGGALKGLLIGLKFLTFGKYFITAGSMMVSVLAYSALYGWHLGAGVVLLIFAHEAGHAVAIKQLGYQVRAMVFIPLLGAFVQRDAVGSAAQAAQIAIMGPVAGMLAGLACGAVYGMTGSPIWLVLSYFSFYMNLFNLSAIPFLDGGRVAAIIPPKILLGGLLATAVINYRCPVSWLLVLFALPQITSQWRLGIDPALQVSKQDQRTYSLAYFGLVLLLGFASLTTQGWLWDLRRMSRHF